MAKQIRRNQVEAIAAALSKHYSTDGGGSGLGGPKVFPGEHEESSSAWIISWEECPDYEWVYNLDLFSDLCDQHAPGFFAEPINHFAMAFYPS
ncbi:hypothetical protein MUG78_16935 [Gordonia alkaliphila]|uniref:hypothetical protein n=1 Tax=Gordonia alkaliphila TaxID=1053547 RepID=UPI001FF62542|nr:hypothetical protein [Gordonia alkaliphila]MCK0441087.1 hypothetical protein [Gordonia alkaliphila]